MPFASCGERPTEPDQRHSVGRRSARPGNADSRAPTSRPACRPTTSPASQPRSRCRSRQRVPAAVCTTRHPAFRPLRAFESSSPTSSTSAGTALERLSIEIGCGLWFGEAATFCRPSAPADTICRPSASVVGFDVRQRWRWRVLLLASPPPQLRRPCPRPPRPTPRDPFEVFFGAVA